MKEYFLVLKTDKNFSTLVNSWRGFVPTGVTGQTRGDVSDGGRTGVHRRLSENGRNIGVWMTRRDPRRTKDGPQKWRHGNGFLEEGEVVRVRVGTKSWLILWSWGSSEEIRGIERPLGEERRRSICIRNRWAWRDRHSGGSPTLTYCLGWRDVLCVPICLFPVSVRLTRWGRYSLLCVLDWIVFLFNNFYINSRQIFIWECEINIKFYILVCCTRKNEVVRKFINITYRNRSKFFFYSSITH